MKIIHERPGVVILRMRTLTEMKDYGGFGKTKKGAELEEFMRNLELRKPHETDDRYVKTIALAPLESNMVEHEIYAGLRILGYYPASFSEGMCYLREIRDVPVGEIVHLGTHLLDSEKREWRFVTSGRTSLWKEHHYSKKPYKQHVSIIAVKEEKTPASKK